MMPKVACMVLLITSLLEVSGVPLNNAGDSVPFLKKWAKFKNSKGELVLVNVYPDEEEQLVSNYEVDPAQVEFHLYKKLDPETPRRIFLNDSVTLHEAGFNPKLKTKFLVHGFLNDLKSDIIQNIKNNFLTVPHEDFNVIAVDWSIYTIVYENVDEKSEAMGSVISEFIDFLVAEGASLEDIHCIGHSLGAHACGFAGNAVRSGLIGRITGLDPALPGFNAATSSQRLDSADARYVDCIHTCGGFLGIDEPICTADFYPNAGRNQPGCSWFDFGSCSHGRSHELFAESILQEHLFPSFSCESVEFTPEKCTFTGDLMGYPSNENTVGIFYSKTNDVYPYAMNWTLLELVDKLF